VPTRVAMAAPALALALGLALPAPAAEPTQTLWLAAILLPTALILGASKPRLLAGGALLVAAGALLLPGATGLALPLALLALHFDPRRAALRAQEVWLGLLLAATLVAAAYPWLRDDPLLWTLELAAAPWWLLAGLACLLVNGLAAIQRRHRRPALVAACLSLGLVALRLGAPHVGVGTELLAGVPLTVDSERSSWKRAVEPARPVGRLLVDSSLANSTGLEPGTVVATVVLEAGDHSTRWPLRAGEETGEWAARRIRAQGGAPLAASAWITWVAPPGDHFGQWYRARRQLTEPLEGVTSIRLEREPGLPAEASFSVSRLELLP
jgi:hypothetical protein